MSVVDDDEDHPTIKIPKPKKSSSSSSSSSRRSSKKTTNILDRINQSKEKSPSPEEERPSLKRLSPEEPEHHNDSQLQDDDDENDDSPSKDVSVEIIKYPSTEKTLNESIVSSELQINQLKSDEDIIRQISQTSITSDDESHVSSAKTELASEYSALMINEEFIRSMVPNTFKLTSLLHYTNDKSKDKSNYRFGYGIKSTKEIIPSSSSSSSSSSSFSSSSRQKVIYELLFNENKYSLPVYTKEYGPYIILCNASLETPILIFTHDELNKIYSTVKKDDDMKLFLKRPCGGYLADQNVFMFIVAPSVEIANILFLKLFSSEAFNENVHSRAIKFQQSWNVSYSKLS